MLGLQSLENTGWLGEGIFAATSITQDALLAVLTGKLPDPGGFKGQAVFYFKYVFLDLQGFQHPILATMACLGYQNGYQSYPAASNYLRNVN